MSATEINSKTAEAVAAIGAGEHETALRKLNAVKALLAGMPNVTHGEERLEWDREHIDTLITQIRRREVGKAGVVRSKIAYGSVGG